MRRSLPGVNAELAAAVRRVNAIYSVIPASRQPDLDGSSWRRLEAEVDRACGAGDREAALLAIKRWEEHAQRVLAPLALNAPLEVAS